MSANGHKSSLLDRILGRGHVEPAEAPEAKTDPRVDQFFREADDMVSSAAIVGQMLRTIDRHQLPRQAGETE